MGVGTLSFLFFFFMVGTVSCRACVSLVKDSAWKLRV